MYRTASETHYSLFRSRNMPFTSPHCIIIITFTRCVDIIHKLGHSAQILKQISASTTFLIYCTTNNAIFFFIIFFFFKLLKMSFNTLRLELFSLQLYVTQICVSTETLEQFNVIWLMSTLPNF